MFTISAGWVQHLETIYTESLYQENRRRSRRSRKTLPFLMNTIGLGIQHSISSINFLRKVLAAISGANFLAQMGPGSGRRTARTQFLLCPCLPFARPFFLSRIILFHCLPFARVFSLSKISYHRWPWGARGGVS